MRPYSEIVLDRYTEAGPPVTKFTVTFCPSCETAWQLFRENSRGELLLSYFTHFARKYLDEGICPTCKKVNLP